MENHMYFKKNLYINLSLSVIFIFPINVLSPFVYRSGEEKKNTLKFWIPGVVGSPLLQFLPVHWKTTGKFEGTRTEKVPMQSK